VGPEDLFPVPGGEWVLSSGMTANGAIRVINLRDKTTTVLFPTASPKVRPDTRTYNSCPGPIDLSDRDKFRAHGLYLRPGKNSVHTVYLVHHGTRESIEVFEVDTGARPPTFTWVGCAVAPQTAGFNSVTPLPEGGFAATSPNRRGNPPPKPDPTNTGEVWEWSARDGWKIVPGSESQGPNGIEATRDGKWLYINLWPARKIMRLSRGQTQVARDTVDVTFHPDNIRWQADGSLLTAGHYAPTIEKATECLRKKCPDAAARVARLDPETMKAKEIVNYPSSDVFFGATAALQVGKEIWIGSVRGDRVARYPLR